jgi:hypothetical protein
METIVITNFCINCGLEIICVRSEASDHVQLDVIPEKRFILDSNSPTAKLIDTYISHSVTCPGETGTEATTMTTDFPDVETQHLCAMNEYSADYPSEAVTTAAARQVWEYVFEEPWPEDLIVVFYDLWAPKDANAVQGDCIRPRRKIVLDWQALNQDFERFGGKYPDAVLGTLVHEFIRLRLRLDEIAARHSPGFRQAFVAAYSRLGNKRLGEWLCELDEAWKFGGLVIERVETDEGEPGKDSRT